jgi:hypothetical protein
MSPIEDLYKQAQLAEAAYANFLATGGGLITDRDGVISALQNEGFSESQATAFVSEWQVIDHIPNNKWGQVHISHFQHSFRREASLACGSSSLRSARHAL